MFYIHKRTEPSIWDVLNGPKLCCFRLMISTKSTYILEQMIPERVLDSQWFQFFNMVYL